MNARCLSVLKSKRSARHTFEYKRSSSFFRSIIDEGGLAIWGISSLLAIKYTPFKLTIWYEFVSSKANSPTNAQQAIKTHSKLWEIKIIKNIFKKNLIGFEIFLALSSRLVHFQRQQVFLEVRRLLRCCFVLFLRPHFFHFKLFQLKQINIQEIVWFLLQNRQNYWNSTDKAYFFFVIVVGA